MFNLFGREAGRPTCRILGVLRPFFLLVHFGAALTTCGILLVPQDGKSSISCLCLRILCEPHLIISFFLLGTDLCSLGAVLFGLGLCGIVIQVSIYAWTVGNLAVVCSLPGFYLVGLKWYPKVPALERDVEA